VLALGAVAIFVGQVEPLHALVGLLVLLAEIAVTQQGQAFVCAQLRRLLFQKGGDAILLEVLRRGEDVAAIGSAPQAQTDP
jgi:hypothetical protein